MKQYRTAFSGWAGQNQITQIEGLYTASHRPLTPIHLHVVEDFSWAVVPQITSIRIRGSGSLVKAPQRGVTHKICTAQQAGRIYALLARHCARSLILHLRSTSKEFVTHTCTSLDAVARVAVSPHAKILQAAVASVCHVHATSAAISLLTVTQASWFLLSYHSVRGLSCPHNASARFWFLSHMRPNSSPADLGMLSSLSNASARARGSARTSMASPLSLHSQRRKVKI